MSKKRPYKKKRNIYKILFYILVFCITFWYAPNQWGCYWRVTDEQILNRNNRYVITYSDPIDMGSYYLVIRKEGYEPN